MTLYFSLQRANHLMMFIFPPKENLAYARSSLF